MCPSLDVNDAFDPSFIDIIAVDRITEAVDQYGRAVRLKHRINGIKAVVTATGPDDLQRLPDYEMANKSISVYCPEFRLQGPVRDPATGSLTQTQPDEVIWQNSTFVVHSMQDYSRYGRGFTSAICISIEAVDAPPLGGTAGLA
jgi:hypothetical protein